MSVETQKEKLPSAFECVLGGERIKEICQRLELEGEDKKTLEEVLAKLKNPSANPLETLFFIQREFENHPRVSALFFACYFLWQEYLAQVKFIQENYSPLLGKEAQKAPYN